jgi:hypothetical protein
MEAVYRIPRDPLGRVLQREFGLPRDEVRVYCGGQVL